MNNCYKINWSKPQLHANDDQEWKWKKKIFIWRQGGEKYIYTVLFKFRKLYRFETNRKDVFFRGAALLLIFVRKHQGKYYHEKHA